MESIDLNQLKIAVGIVLSIVTIALVGSERIARKVEKAGVRWIKAIKRIREEWHKPLTIEKPPESPQLLKKTRSKREFEKRFKLSLGTSTFLPFCKCYFSLTLRTELVTTLKRQAIEILN